VREQACRCGRGGRSAVIESAVAADGRFVLRGKRTLQGGP
jgi:hypothetical protein